MKTGMKTSMIAAVALAVPATLLAQAAEDEKARCERRPVLCEMIKRKIGMDATVERKPNPPASDSFRYGVDPLQAVDIWKPKDAKGSAPLLVFVHGGGWTRGSKDNAVGPDKIAAFIRRGYVFAAINYRLVPQVGVADQPRDVAAAINFLRAKADALGIDPQRIVLMGHSAGAHLAALVGTDPSYLGKGLAAVRAVILLDGAGYDLPRQRTEAGRIEARIYEQPFGALSAAELVRLSPTRQAAAPNAAAFLIVHDADRQGAVSQGEALETALRDAGTDVQRAPFGGTSHMALNWNVGKPGDPETETIFGFLDRLGL